MGYERSFAKRAPLFHIARRSLTAPAPYLLKLYWHSRSCVKSCLAGSAAYCRPAETCRLSPAFKAVELRVSGVENAENFFDKHFSSVQKKSLTSTFAGRKIGTILEEREDAVDETLCRLLFYLLRHGGSLLHFSQIARISVFSRSTAASTLNEPWTFLV